MTVACKCERCTSIFLNTSQWAKYTAAVAPRCHNNKVLHCTAVCRNVRLYKNASFYHGVNIFKNFKKKHHLKTFATFPSFYMYATWTHIHWSPTNTLIFQHSHLKQLPNLFTFSSVQAAQNLYLLQFA